MLDVAEEEALLDIGGDATAVHRGGEGRQQGGIVLGDGEVALVAAGDFRHGEGDEGGDVAVGPVVEAIADANLPRRDEQVLGAHLDAVSAPEDQTAGAHGGDAVVRLDRRGQHECGQNGGDAPVQSDHLVLPRSD